MWVINIKNVIEHSLILIRSVEIIDFDVSYTITSGETVLTVSEKVSELSF